MGGRHLALLTAGLAALLLAGACGNAAGRSEGVMTVTDLLARPVYHQEVAVSGQVKGLGEAMCTCFELVDNGQSITVWYDSILNADGSAWPAVSVAGIRNGDRVTVTGELNQPGEFTDTNDLWATSIERVE